VRLRLRLLHLKQVSGERLLGILAGPLSLVDSFLLAVHLHGVAPGLALRALAGDLPGALVHLGQGQSPFVIAPVYCPPYLRSSTTPTPRARASRSATSSDSLCRVPVSSWAIYPWVTFACAASFSWVQPLSSRRRRIIAPSLLAIGGWILL